MIELLKPELKALANPKKARLLQRFFKTKKGEYGEGDVFLGITVPQSRALAKKYSGLNFIEIKSLLESKIHEERLIAILLLVHLYKTTKNKDKIVDFYLSHTHNINNWDLVDLSAYKILGDYFYVNPSKKEVLYKLAKSSNIWERRIAIISTFAFIKNKKFEDSLKLAEILLNDKHDLMHKAVGWMLREIGKKDLQVLENFLKKHCKTMPRTMLRYSIEKLSKEKRQRYLKGRI